MITRLALLSQVFALWHPESRLRVDVIVSWDVACSSITPTAVTGRAVRLQRRVVELSASLV